MMVAVLGSAIVLVCGREEYMKAPRYKPSGTESWSGVTLGPDL